MHVKKHEIIRKKIGKWRNVRYDMIDHHVYRI